MSANLLASPYPLFVDTDGTPLKGGQIYVGTTGQNPATSPIALYWDEAMTQAASQPLSVRGGCIVRSGTPARVYFAEDDASMMVQSDSGRVVFFSSSVSSNATIRSDLANTAVGKGSKLIAFIQRLTGAVARWVEDKLSESVSVRDFGAKGDGTTDDTSAIQAAINAVNAAGGGVLCVPRGTYIVGALTMKPKVRLIGDGQESTILQSSHTGPGLKMSSTINSSVSVQTSVENLQIKNTNASNTDGAYADVGGTFVNFFNVYFNGFKYGLILDQTELATVRQCQFANNKRAGLWLVNGSEYTTGALGLFTNRIAVTECQFNEGATAYCVIDDGGYAHSFKDNNFNGGLNSMLIAAVEPITIADNEFESAAGTNIIFSGTTAGGVSVGQSINALLQSNIIVPQAGQSCISCVSGPAELVMVNNSLGNSTAAKIIGLSLVARFVDLGNHNLGGPFSTGTPTTQFRDADTGSFTPVITFGGASVGITYGTQLGTYSRMGKTVSFSIHITLTSKGTSTGSMAISGLPYTSTAGVTQPANPGFATGIVSASSLAGWILPGTSSIQMQNAQVNYTATLSDANVSNTTTLMITGTYLAA